MHALAYRVARRPDMEAIARLRRPGEPGGAALDRMLAYAEGSHHPQHARAARVIWAAWDADRPVAYAAGHLTERFGCDGEIQWIYVAADRRRQRVGAALLRLLARWFVDHGARRVCVDVGGEAARPFYEHQGARPLNPHWMVWDDVGQLLATGPARE